MTEPEIAHPFSTPVVGKSRSPLPYALRTSSCSSSRSPASVSSALLGSPRKEVVEVTSRADNMAACFQQYWFVHVFGVASSCTDIDNSASCERLISTPCSSILYCSEACRLKDSAKPLSAAVLGVSTPPMLMGASPFSSAPSSPRTMLAPRSPFGVSTFGDRSTTRIPADNHGSKSDLDPTEWKPKEKTARPASSRYNSEAYRYLSSFHRSISKFNFNEGDGRDTEGGVSFSVPTSTSAGSTPSLVHTPSTTASSYGSVPTTSLDSNITSTYTTSIYTGLDKNGYDFSTRPLAPRHSRWHSMNGPNGVGIGADLVTPHVAPAYTKSEVGVGVRSGQSGLGTFFGRAATGG